MRAPSTNGKYCVVDIGPPIIWATPEPETSASNETTTLLLDITYLDDKKARRVTDRVSQPGPRTPRRAHAPSRKVARATPLRLAYFLRRGFRRLGSTHRRLLIQLQPLEDRPGGQPLVIPVAHDLGVAPIDAYAPQPVRVAHPSPGVPLSIRFLRLTL